MTVETFDIQRQAQTAVTVTPAAAEHFRKQQAARGFTGIRLGLTKSGCSGYKYVIDEVQAPEDGDYTVNLGNGVMLFLSGKDIVALSGLELDYVQEGVNLRLVINNPNATDACGCGESVSF